MPYSRISCSTAVARDMLMDAKSAAVREGIVEELSVASEVVFVVVSVVVDVLVVPSEVIETPFHFMLPQMPFSG